MKPKTKLDPTAATSEPSAAAIRLGVIAEGSLPGALIVEYDGCGPVPARAIIALDEPMVRRAIHARQPALLLFENGDARLPIVVGLIQPTLGAELLDALLAPRPAAGPAPVERAGEPPGSAAAATPPLEARVDGKRVVLEGQEEVTIKCGDASISLRRDGKLTLRGAYIETTATGVNRIRGGSVKIN